MLQAVCALDARPPENSKCEILVLVREDSKHCIIVKEKKFLHSNVKLISWVAQSQSEGLKQPLLTHAVSNETR